MPSPVSDLPQGMWPLMGGRLWLPCHIQGGHAGAGALDLGQSILPIVQRAKLSPG